MDTLMLSSVLSLGATTILIQKPIMLLDEKLLKKNFKFKSNNFIFTSNINKNDEINF